MKKMNFKEVGIPTIVLFVICIVVAGALAFTNQLTKDKIAENALQKEISARQAVLAGTEYELVSEENGVQIYAVLVSEKPGAAAPVTDTDITNTDITPTDVRYDIWTGIPSAEAELSEASDTDISKTDSVVSGSELNPESESDLPVSETDTVSETDAPEGTKYILGYVATTEGKGFGGGIQIMIGVDLDLKITGIEILSQGETAGLGANCTKESWLAQFVGQSGVLAVDKDGGEIDSITASTITSRAVTGAVNNALAAVTEFEERRLAQ